MISGVIPQSETTGDVTGDMEDLLEKTRIVCRVLQNRPDNRTPDYQRLAKLLSDLSNANVYMINREGKILGYSWVSEYDCDIMEGLLIENAMPEQYVDKLNMARESVLNHTDNGHCGRAGVPLPSCHSGIIVPLSTTFT